MMTFENLLFDVESGIATVTVNRPEKLNALNAATIRELGTCFEAIAGQDSIQVVILRGAGEKAFVAGADINELSRMKASEAEMIARQGQAVMNRIENLGKPVIGAIGGFALGGGCELAMACTFRYAAHSARLGLPETGLGLIPGFGGTQRLPRLIGKGRALELILGGEMISADEACTLGLINKVFPAGELMDAVHSMAESLVTKSSLTLRLALQAVNGGMEISQDSGCHLEAGLFGVAGASNDAHEGCSAFLEKRKPQFRNI